MPIPKRIEYPGAIYHVMAHGNGYQWIYKSKENIYDYISILNDVIIKYNFFIHCFVIMQNHYHMLIETPNGNLSMGMKKMNRDFAKATNLKLGRKGSIFKQRYKAILIDKENYYLNVLKYIYQNPIRIGLVSKAEQYPGSGLYYLKNKKNLEIEKILYLDTQKELFGGTDFKEKLIEFVNDGKAEDPLTNNKYKYILGNQNWINEIKEKYLSHEHNENYIELKKIIQKEITEEKIYKLTEGKENSNEIRMYLLNQYTGLSQEEIGKRINIEKKNTVCQKLRRFKLKMATEEKLQLTMKELENVLID